jgi:hypothetical protein
MKKMFLLLIISLIGMIPLLADNDKAITRNELPEQAQVFIDKHFVGVEVLYAKAERDMGVITSYDVVLNGDVKIEFNRSGEWTSVDCNRGQVPDSVLPKTILDYVTTKFTKSYVVEIERNMMGYDVKLNNDLELDFNKEGKFLRVD